MRRGTHVLRKPAHHDGEEQPEESGDSWREDTRNECECGFGVFRPLVQRIPEGCELQTK